MTAIILAAGRGGRLRGVLGDRPKCLARIGDNTLLERQIAAIQGVGIDDVVIVTGYRADLVRRACSPRAKVIHNARFAATNSLYSLWLARHLLSGPVAVFNCDVLFHLDTLGDLVESTHEDALLISRRTEATTYTDEEMKVSIRDRRVTAISKALPLEDTDGENVGIAKFGVAGAALLREELERLVGEGHSTDWLPLAFASFCRRRPLHVVETADRPWIEIDVPEDYWHACREVLPAIDRLATVPRGEVSRDGDSSSHESAPATAFGTRRTYRHV